MKSITSTLAALSVIALLPTPVLAQHGNDNASGGGSSGSDRLSGPYEWAVAASSESRIAWDAFTQQSGWPQEKLETHLRSSGVGTGSPARNLCEEAEMVFWSKSTTDPQKRWSFNAHGGQQALHLTTDSVFKPLGSSGQYAFTDPISGQKKLVSNWFTNKITSATSTNVSRNQLSPSQNEKHRFLVLDYLPRIVADSLPEFKPLYAFYRDYQKEEGIFKAAVLIGIDRLLNNEDIRAIERLKLKRDTLLESLESDRRNNNIPMDMLRSDNYAEKILYHYRYRIKDNLVCSQPPPQYKICPAMSGQEPILNDFGNGPEQVYWKLDPNGKIWNDLPWRGRFDNRIYVRPDHPDRDTDTTNDTTRGLNKYTVVNNDPQCNVGPSICPVRSENGQHALHPTRNRPWYVLTTPEGGFLDEGGVEQQMVIDPERPTTDGTPDNDHIRSIRGYRVVESPLCKTGAPPPPPPPAGDEGNVTLTIPPEESQKRYPYDKRTTLTSDYVNIPGRDAFQPQTTPIVQTEYGKLLNDPARLPGRVVHEITNPATNYDDATNVNELIQRAKAKSQKPLFEQRIEQVRSIDRTKPGPTLDMSEGNRAILGKGAVYSINELTTWAKATIKTTYETSYKTLSKTICTQRAPKPRTKHDAAEGTCLQTETRTRTVPDKIKVTTTVEREHPYSIESSKRNTGHYQIMDAKCNKDGIDKVRGTTRTINVAGMNVQEGIVPHHISAEGRGLDGTVTTTPITWANDDFSPGDPNGVRPPRTLLGPTSDVLPETGTDAFFSKECPFVCTPDASQHNGASDANGATTNVGDGVTHPRPPREAGKPTDQDRYGAHALTVRPFSPDQPKPKVEDTVNTSHFVFPRDNEPRAIHVDTWYPQRSDAVKYDGHAPLTTTITRNALGTPFIFQPNYKDGSPAQKIPPAHRVSGGFRIKSSGNKLDVQSDRLGTPPEHTPIGHGIATPDFLFEPNNAPVPTQWAWDTTPFRNAYTDIRPGLHRTLIVQAPWASSVGQPAYTADGNPKPGETYQPHLFNLKWEYQPQVKSEIPVQNLGFGSTNQGRPQNPLHNTTTWTPTQGKCYAQFGTTQGLDTTQVFSQSTGLGTTNTLDAQLYAPPTTPHIQHETMLGVEFIRGVSE